MQRAAERYSFYRFDPEGPDNPLGEGTLPDGGAAFALVDALAERAGGVRWRSCEEELKGLPPLPEPRGFKC